MWQKNVRYLDYNASAGISGSVREKLIEYLKNEEAGLANPSSRHRLGQKEHHVLFESARTISRSFGEGVTPEDLVFTSSGTEANQAIIQSFVKSGFGIMIGAGEHPASHELIESLRRTHPNLWIETLPLTQSGNHDLESLARLAAQAKQKGVETIGLSLFWANNETGVLASLQELKLLQERLPVKVVLHLDGAQVWGKIPLDLVNSPADFVSFSSHKIGAPAGAGVIWKRKGREFHPLFQGSQNFGFRGGSENLLGILGLKFACESLDPKRFVEVTAPLQARLEQGLQAGIQNGIQNIVIWGTGEKRVTNTVRFSLTGFQSYENWVELLDLSGFAVSQGSACRARIVEPSRVLLAMGALREDALNSIRVSLGPDSTVDDVDLFLRALGSLLQQKGKA